MASQLETLVAFWRAEAGSHEAWDDPEFEQWVKIADQAAETLALQRAGWVQFCESLGIDPDQPVRVLCPMLVDSPDWPSCDSTPDPEAVNELAESFRAEFARKEAEWA